MVVPQASPSSAVPEPEGKFLGYTSLTWSKIVPLALMFFCILFNYTILRDTKVLLTFFLGGGEGRENARTTGLPFAAGCLVT